MSDSETIRDVGYLKGSLEALAASVHEGQKESRDGRARIYAELEASRHDAAEIRRQITSLREGIEADKPVINDIRKWKERFIGMQMLIVFVAGTIGGGIVAFWKWIMVKIGGV